MASKKECECCKRRVTVNWFSDDPENDDGSGLSRVCKTCEKGIRQYAGYAHMLPPLSEEEDG